MQYSILHNAGQLIDLFSQPRNSLAQLLQYYIVFQCLTGLSGLLTTGDSQTKLYQFNDCFGAVAFGVVSRVIQNLAEYVIGDSEGNGFRPGG